MSKEIDTRLGAEISTEPLLERQEIPNKRAVTASHYIIEQLLNGIETSEKSKWYLSAVGDAAFMKDDEAFLETLKNLRDFTKHTLDAFNHISRYIGGIPVRLSHEGDEVSATVISLTNQQGNSWTFSHILDGGSDFSKTYNSVSQLRSAHEAHTLTTMQTAQQLQAE